VGEGRERRGEGRGKIEKRYVMRAISSPGCRLEISFAVMMDGTFRNF